MSVSVSVSVCVGVTISQLYKAPSNKSTWLTMRGVGRGRRRVCLCASRLLGKGKKIQKHKELRMRGRANGIEPEFLEEQEQQQFESSSEEEICQWSQTPHQLGAYVFLLAAIPLGLMLPDASWSSACYFLYLGVWTLYVGSHRSLGTKPPKKVSLREGILAPLFCSISLFGFYCLLHFFPNLDLQAFLSAYFALVGVFAVAGNMVDLVGTLLPTTNAQLFQLEVPEWLLDENKSPVQLSSTFADVLALCVGVAIVTAYKQAGAPFILNNFIATCIATEVLHLFSLGSFVTATTLLSGLLLYDVFWVFGSSHMFGDNVMVTVATSRAFDGPIKLIFPHLKGSSSFPYSLLGLGDVTVPGLFTALMLKFDRSQFRTKAHTAYEDSSMGLITKPRKIYFTTCIASYIFGLVLTIVANELFGVAQPALLYLVPSQLVGVSLISFVRSEFPLLLHYNDEVMGNSASVDQ